MTVYEPTKSAFLERAQRGNVIPVYREILADMETPVSAFKKVGNLPYSFLLESVEGGETLGRYSFLGTSPRAVFRAKGNEVEIEYAQGRKESFRDDVPIFSLRRLMAKYRYVPDPALPPFCGGAVGYVAYDAVRAFEEIGNHAEDDLNLPDLFFLITDTLLIFDHVKHRVRILANAFIDERTSASEAYDEAVARINALHAALARPLEISEQTLNSVPVRLESNFTKDGFENTVERCKEYIRAGDIFQVVISQRFRVPLSSSPFDVYRALRAINPSPYMFFLNFGQVCLAGSSPEILVKLTGSTVQLRPIAGTRRRGESKEEDIALERELLADPKERAEHIMLVDLGRNDCGRVCEYGSVRVDDLMIIERYSHVMHIVSNVVGKLRQGLDAYDVFAAAFPAGTVTGAPKIRAMQIIEELEPVRRGPYAGAVGYFSFNGNLDACITIRTIVMKGGDAFIQAGAGIVADSIPENEFKETINKASAMIRAIELAERGLE
ncbi:MAG: anthranilate synthase component I [Candidatus Hydrogenedentota bacterium]|uniref:Anthranilate synthase component 1 n=1 Tax=Sumerlaea chitinivorans TaxID=2250252 RepID=A0A2Z4Y3J6_SUMC1|nr:Anthranilate synthase, aminase component [Candidatus Sumerlaea chitinivorans]RMH27597.1 MAG: anthranilate synthase component I [Candidatus Hydrogenedentota bacterium]